MLTYDDIIDQAINETASVEEEIKRIVEPLIIDSPKTKLTFIELSTLDFDYCTVLLAGGLGGDGDWEDYLHDLTEQIKVFNSKFDYETQHSIIHTIDNDPLDDVFYAEIEIPIGVNQLNRNHLITMSENYNDASDEFVYLDFEFFNDYYIRVSTRIDNVVEVVIEKEKDKYETYTKHCNDIDEAISIFEAIVNNIEDVDSEYLKNLFE